MINAKWKETTDLIQINNFFNILSLCHSVFPNLSYKGISYQGASPDDIALVDGAAQFGYIFSNKDYNTITIFNEILDVFTIWLFFPCIENFRDKFASNALQASCSIQERIIKVALPIQF